MNLDFFVIFRFVVYSVDINFDILYVAIKYTYLLQ